MGIPTKAIDNYDSDANTGEQRTIGPAKKLFSVTLDATLDSVARGMLVGTAGNVSLTFRDGATLAVPLQAGWNPVEFIRVNTSGTTASNLFYFI